MRVDVHPPNIQAGLAQEATDLSRGQARMPWEVRRYILVWEDEFYDAGEWPPTTFEASTLSSLWHADPLHLPILASLPISIPACAWLRIRTIPLWFGQEAFHEIRPTYGQLWENCNFLDSVTLTFPEVGGTLDLALGNTQDIELAGGLPRSRLNYHKRTWRWADGHASEDRVHIGWTATQLEILIGHSGTMPQLPRAPAGIVADLGTAQMYYVGTQDGGPARLYAATYYPLVFPAYTALHHYWFEAVGTLFTGSVCQGMLRGWVGRIPQEDFGVTMTQDGMIMHIFNHTCAQSILQCAAGMSDTRWPMNFSPQLAGFDGAWTVRLAPTDASATQVAQYFLCLTE